MAEEIKNEETEVETAEGPKTYQIYEILAAAAEWLNDPEDEEKANLFETIKSQLIVREYMPLGQKEICLRKAIIDVRSDEELMPYTASILYEIAVLFDCLLAYVVNLEPDIDSLYKDASFYDLIVMSGLKDYILSFCGKDYEDMRHMADRMITFDNLKELTKMLNFASDEEVRSLTNEFKNFTTNTDTELLRGLSKLMAMNDPLMNSIKNSVEDTAFRYAQTVEDGDESSNNKEKADK